MSLQTFYKNFGLETSLISEQQKFVHRINQTYFNLLKINAYPDDYEKIFLNVCYQYGINGSEMLAEANQWNYGYDTFVPHLKEITKNDFMETLKVLTLLYDSLSNENQKRLTLNIELALSQSVIDLGVRWKDGMFYPAGAKELDEKLINDSLDWLDDYPESKNYFLIALNHFNTSLNDISARKDAITNAYSALENLARVILQNKKNFDANSDELVVKLNLPTEYRQIIYYYKQIANGYSSRHDGKEFSHIETEAFIYLSGIIIRLAVNKAK